MKNNVLIFGIGDFADILSEKLKEASVEISGYIVNAKYFKEDNYCEKPVYIFEELGMHFQPENTSVYIGVIGKQMLKFRKDIFGILQKYGYHLPNYIAPSASVHTMEIGQGNIIMENVVVESHCSIGNGNIIWPNVVMPHHNRVGDFNNLSPSVSFSGYSEVGDRCFVGNNSCLNNHIKVSNYALVGAGVFVARDLAEEQVLVSERSYVLKGKKSYEFK